MLQRRRHRSGEVIVTPLVDMMIFVVCYLIVSQSDAAEFALEKDFQSGRVEDPPAKVQPELVDVPIVINKTGQYSQQQQPKTLAEIEQYLTQLQGKNVLVYLVPDANCPWQPIAELKALIQKHKLTYTEIVEKKP